MPRRKPGEARASLTFKHRVADRVLKQGVVEYDMEAVSWLAVAVMKSAIDDLRTQTPHPVRKYRRGKPYVRKNKYESAYELLNDIAPGPGKMTMLDFLCIHMGCSKDAVQLYLKKGRLIACELKK